MKKPKCSVLTSAALAALLLTGCSSALMTNPARSVTEQLLLSTAADRAIASISLTEFAQKKVFVDATYFDSYDSKYMIGSIRDALSRAGASLEPSVTNADYVVEARSGGLSIDDSSTLIGLPQTGLPIPLAGTFSIPEIALWKSDRQNSIAKFALLSYSVQSREHFFSSGPMVGASFNRYYKLLGMIQWTRSDIPEKQKKKKPKKNE